MLMLLNESGLDILRKINMNDSNGPGKIILHIIDWVEDQLKKVVLFFDKIEDALHFSSENKSGTHKIYDGNGDLTHSTTYGQPDQDTYA
jgi:hypothetical protein